MGQGECMNQVTIPQPAHVYDVIAFQEQGFNNVIVGDSVTWAKESQFATQALQKNDFLNKVAWQNQQSLQNAIINVAAIGISLNPALKHAYLVPRDKMVCLDVSYMGLLHLAMQSGAIEWGQAKLVYSNDVYTNNGIDKAPTHNQNTFGDKGQIIGVYCVVKLKNGDFITEEMDMDAINKVKATSKSLSGAGAKYSPWNTFPEEMIRKTVVKRGSKYWPSCERLRTAVDVLNEHEGVITEEEADIAKSEEKNLDVETLNKMLNSGDFFNFFPYLQTRDEITQGRFYSSFAKGTVSESKVKARELQNTGIATWKDMVKDIKDMIKKQDKAGIQEIVKDFENYHKHHLIEMLGKQAQEFKDLLTGEK